MDLYIYIFFNLFFSLFVGQGGHLNRSNSGVIGQKKHPTMAIYRPPSTYNILCHDVMSNRTAAGGVHP